MDDEEGSIKERELDLAFFNDGYKIAGVLQYSNTPAMLYKAVKQMYVGIDSFIDLFLNNAESSGSPAHCAKGCAWCCHQAVFAQSHEIKYLKKWMFDHLSEEEMEGVRQRAKQKYRNTKDISIEARQLFKEACPLLKDNACMAYDARPMACRIYLSYNRDSCAYEFEHADDKSHFPQLFDFPLRSGKKMNEGFVTRLREFGWEINEKRMEEGMR